MKLLINNKEIAHFLLSLVNHLPAIQKIPVYEPLTKENIDEFRKKETKFLKSKKRRTATYSASLDDAAKLKLKNKIVRAVTKDTREHIKFCLEQLKKREINYYNLVHGNIEFFIDRLGIETIFDLYKNNKKQNFVKSVGLKLDPTGDFMRRKDFIDYTQDALIRNTVGNESLLVTKIDQGYPFWFIDSGFTNFVEPAKKWHRLVRNHLHYGKYFDAPPDRLGNFRVFPKPWRESGEIIYIIEPGPFAASIFHVDLKTWKYDVEAELRKYTDKPIKFREKAPKLERTSLYQELLDEDYYCVISINSNASTEAIWAGVPAITLDRHVTNQVTRNKISDINNLFRGNIAEWLCYLSYNQFTKKELENGTALDIVRKWHV